DDGRLVGRRLVVDRELVAIGQRVGDAYRQSAGIAFFAISADVGEGHAVRQRLSTPDDAVEAFRAAMQMVGAIVGRQPERLSIESGARLGDPVRESPDHGAEVRRVVAYVV